jgi:hypothetical protein
MYLLGYNFILLYIEHAHFYFSDDYSIILHGVDIPSYLGTENLTGL